MACSAQLEQESFCRLQTVKQPQKRGGAKQGAAVSSGGKQTTPGDPAGIKVRTVHSKSLCSSILTACQQAHHGWQDAVLCTKLPREGSTSITCHFEYRLAGLCDHSHLSPQPAPVTYKLMACPQGASVGKRKGKCGVIPGAPKKKVSAVLCAFAPSHLHAWPCMPLALHHGACFASPSDFWAHMAGPCIEHSFCNVSWMSCDVHKYVFCTKTKCSCLVISQRAKATQSVPPTSDGAGANSTGRPRRRAKEAAQVGLTAAAMAGHDDILTADDSDT